MPMKVKIKDIDPAHAVEADDQDQTQQHQRNPLQTGHSTALRLPNLPPWGMLGGEVMEMYDLDKRAFGAFVAALRKEKGLTQRELTERLHITDKAVSKWETGASIPDTALLIPLSELLGVTATELLLCRRQAQPMEPEAVEAVVQTAIRCAGGRPKRAWQEKGPWPVWYALSLLVGALGLWANWTWTGVPEALWTAVLLGAVFGAWFCFFTRLVLPEVYDQYPLGMVRDGPLRMNVPGLTFNNRNWPHIVTVGRAWACAIMAALPLLCLALGLLCPAPWEMAQTGVILALTLGGLFLPLYLVGKKYQ